LHIGSVELVVSLVPANAKTGTASGVFNTAVVVLASLDVVVANEGDRLQPLEGAPGGRWVL